MQCGTTWRLEISVLRNNTILSFVSFGMSRSREGLCFKFVILIMPQGESLSRVMQQAEGSRVRHLV